MTPTRFISGIGSLVVVSAMTAAIAAAPAPAHAQAAFNGTWSVLIITDRGPCDRAYRYPLQVKNGRVTYGGQADFKVDGRVKANGAVEVTVSRGQQRADGSGRLVAGSGSGSGTWQGAGSSSNCSGTWTAEKRG
jgi:hypothetical protein